MALLPSQTLQSTVVEEAVLEVAMLLQKAEESTRLNTSKKNLANVVIDTDNKVATITIRLPLNIRQNGVYTMITGQEYTAHLAFESEELNT